MSRCYQILRLNMIMLFSVFTVNIAFAVPLNASEISFLQAETTHFAQGSDVSFAARAPAIAAAYIEVTGGVTVMQGSALAGYRLADEAVERAPNRTSAWEGVDTTSRDIGANVPDNIAGWVKGPDGSSIPIQKTANGQPDWKRFLQDNAEVTSVSGNVDSGSVRFTQSSIGGNFSDGRSVDDLVTGLRNGTVDPAGGANGGVYYETVSSFQNRFTGDVIRMNNQ